MIAQPELDFTAPAPPTNDEVARLLEHLRLCSGWHTAKELSSALGFRDRKIRQLAEHSAGMVVSGPGSPGYRHIEHCSWDEVNEAAAKLDSQGDHMKTRARVIRQAKSKLSAKR